MLKDIDMVLLKPVEFQSSCSPLTKALVLFHGVEVFFDMLCTFLPPRIVSLLGLQKIEKNPN